MPNMFGGDQFHPAYDPETELQYNQVMDGNTLYTIDDDDNIIVETVDGQVAKYHFSGGRAPQSVCDLKNRLDNQEAWCVKYALTQGVFKITGRLYNGGKRIMSRDTGYYQSFGEREFDKTLEGAMIKAEAMRKKRIASLKKQLTKLEKLEIKVNE